MSASCNDFVFDRTFASPEVTVHCPCGWFRVAPNLHAAHALTIEHIKALPTNEEDES